MNLELKPRSTAKELSQLKDLLEGLKLIQELQEQDDFGKDVPIHITKKPEDAMRDFMGHVARHWHDFMIASDRYFLEEIPLDIIITHPIVRITYKPLFVLSFS